MKLKLAIYWAVAATLFFIGIWVCLGRSHHRWPTAGAGAADLIGLREELAFAMLNSPPPLPRVRSLAVLPRPTYTFYFAATAFDKDGLESGYSNEVIYSTTNPMKPVTLAWDASVSTNRPITYRIYQGGSPGTYTNHYLAGTNLSLTLRPRLPLTNFVITVTTTGATNLIRAPTLLGPWTSINATNWSETNPHGPPFFRAVGKKKGITINIKSSWR